MSLPTWRCLLVLVAVISWSSEASGGDPSWIATFPGSGGNEDSTAFAVGDGRHLIAVPVSGVEAGKGRLKLAGREMPAELFVDPVSRLVVFRMEGPPGKAMPLMASSKVGDQFQFGGGGTGEVEGMVKAVDGKYLPVFLMKVRYEADAPLPGTPLTNAAGAVIGVAHQKTGPRAGYALPVDVVRRVLHDVQNGGQVVRGWIGLIITLPAPKAAGAPAAPEITSVVVGSPSADSGVKPGDILVQVGTRQVVEYADAVNAFYFLRPGIATTIRVKRGNQEMVFPVTPEEPPGE